MCFLCALTLRLSFVPIQWNLTCLGIQTTRGHVYTGGLSLQRDFTPRLTPGGELYGGISDNKGLSKDQLRALVVVPTPPVKISV